MRQIEAHIFRGSRSCDDTSCVLLSIPFSEKERERKKKKRLSTTCGMTRLLGEGLKGDSGQRLLFICYSLSMSFIGIQHLLKSSNHNLKTSHYLHFSTEFYIVRKVERIILNFFDKRKKTPRLEKDGWKKS